MRLGGAARLYDGALLQFDDGTALTLREVDGSPSGDQVTLADDLAGGYF